MANGCKNCFDGCTISTWDKCITYTGDDIEVLDICNGDKINTVIEKIIENLGGYATGEGITIELTPCTYIANKLSADYSLSNILSAFSEALCEIDESIEDIENTISAQYSFNTSCLTISATSPTRDDILQATINQTCSNTTSINSILNDYVKASELNTLIQQYLDTIDNDPETIIQQNSKMVPYVAYEYYGPLTNFDSSGKGLTASGYTKVYICNGSNGTPDKRGRVGVGANIGVPGGAMDSAVDPSVSGNTQVIVKGKIGEFKHLTTLAESPAHTHSTPQTTFTIPIKGQYGGDNDDHNNKTAFAAGDKGIDTPSYFTLNASATAPALTTTAAGGNQAHNNIQPSIGCLFIMYIP